MLPLNRLREFTDVILSPEVHYGKVREACNELYDLFKELSGFEEEEPAAISDIYFEAGMAVGTSSAAFCLIDFWRTRNFMMGIQRAIEERRKEHADKPVTILYAGTGPFATLALPFCSLYTPTQLQLVLLEINPESYQCLQKLIQEMGVSSYIKHIELTDACTWKIPAELQPDILISETMKKGLQKEPQVAVFASLVSQCKKDLILIPEQITVSAALAGKLQVDAPEINRLETLLVLNEKSARDIGQDISMVPALHDGVEVNIPHTDFNVRSLVLHTEIRIYREIEIKFNECSITLPHKLDFDLSRIPCRLRFNYDLGSKPGFRFMYL